MTIHSKTFIHLFTLFIFVGGIFFARWFVTYDFTIIAGLITSITSIILFIANLPLADTHDLINTSKPHSANLYKNSVGRYVLEICRFPLIYRDDFERPNHAEIKYKEILKEDREAAVTRSEAGLVKILATPKKDKKVDIAADAYAHVEAILKQYAPEKVEALNKIKEIFERKD